MEPKKEGGDEMVRRIFFIAIWVLASVGLCIGQWGTPTNVNPVNSLSNELRPAISSDGNTLYLSSDRFGGSGSDDIWESAKSLGVWGAPANLGHPINTASADFLPSINWNGDELYFISDRPGALGLDIYWSQKVGGAWGTPVNLTAVNSAFTE